MHHEGRTRALRVATYNIHKGVLRRLLGLRRRERIHELRERLHALGADLVFLQEVQGRNERHAARFANWPTQPQQEFLATLPGGASGFESVYGLNASYLHGHHGNALLSRFPIVRHENRDVSDHVLEQRGILHCVVQIDRVEAHCFVVHLGLLGVSRRRQLNALIDWIEREVPPDAPLIIAGDFNDWPNHLSAPLTARLGVREVNELADTGHSRIEAVARFLRRRLDVAWPAARGAKRSRLRIARTYPALVPWLAMDRIYQRGFSVVRVRVLRGPSWASLSDHSPLLADLVLLPLELPRSP